MAELRKNKRNIRVPKVMEILGLEPDAVQNGLYSLLTTVTLWEWLHDSWP